MIVTRMTAALGLTVSLAVGLLAGIIPAWQASRVQIASALRKAGVSLLMKGIISLVPKVVPGNQVKRCFFQA